MMYRDVSNNLGKFVISMDMIEHHYDEVLMIMKDILVISAVAQYAEQVIEYKGVSKNILIMLNVDIKYRDIVLYIQKVMMAKYQ